MQAYKVILDDMTNAQIFADAVLVGDYVPEAYFRDENGCVSFTDGYITEIVSDEPLSDCITPDEILWARQFFA